MTTLMAELVRKARRLSAGERERLAGELIAETESAPLTAVDEAWVAEAEARYEAWTAGRTETVDAKQALQRIRKPAYWERRQGGV